MIIAEVTIEHDFNPMFPSDCHAADVLGWLVADPP
jgi:hypothetical protein